MIIGGSDVGGLVTEILRLQEAENAKPLEQKRAEALDDLLSPPADVIAGGASPTTPLCPACIDAYRNGIEPGGTACEEREKP